MFPIKGSSRSDATILPERIRLSANKPLILGVSQLKHTLYSFLTVEDKSEIGYCYFPKKSYYDVDHFQGLMSEKFEVNISNKGTKTERWVVKNHQRNEVLDCRIYALAAFISLLKTKRQRKRNAQIVSAFG